ncbi:UvrD-helicase domain-containing protein [Paenibacillus sp. Soil750]|uniref:UvrD-helicase domain-containing protein n=1 Tax=Paenibacillus sp. Soil750 TaxID=1736398 RepID=UPI0006FD21B6|nr:ATP-dependent helicase [Paenibacillus sp. Soil750]KRE73924.1 hypothetical protein ASL11_06290 [Paenibacillus sp. Soil750]
MNKLDIQNAIAHVLCSKDPTQSFESCFENHTSKTLPCSGYQQCRVTEKTEQQLDYILSSMTDNVFLEACAGSGKTEVVGMKMSYEINKWTNTKSGIAVLTFTNEATDTIVNRVESFSKKTSFHPHYIGTLTGFIHGYISQLFGYKYFNHKKIGDDTSFRLVDKSVDVFNNHWLVKYKISIPYVTSAGHSGDLYANQIYFDFKSNDYIIFIPDNIKMSVTEYYNSPGFSAYVESIRKKTGKEWLFKIEYVKQEFHAAKMKFLGDGFATFEDMNNVGYTILKNRRIARSITTRFPTILIDECQDLSWIEIEILNKLRESGTSLHFIGDLHQSIYEFKDADPAYTKSYLSTFKNLSLTDNFRSCQPIVELANRISSISLPIRGLNKNKLNDDSVCYYEYSDLNLIENQYSILLRRFNLSSDRSTILVRQHNLKSEFEIQHKINTHLLLNAIQLWNLKTPITRRTALEFAGKELQRWFGGARTSKGYHCPSGINSAFRWRIFIKDFLELCCSIPQLTDIVGKNYSHWYKQAREQRSTLLKSAYINLKAFDSDIRDFDNLPTFKAPSGTATDTVVILNNAEKPESITINTIHSVKGSDFDGVLVVSSKHNRGSGAHWKHWLNGNGEGTRIGYVASTRAKYSLIWAVPTLTDEDRGYLESFGFKRIEI